MRCFLTMFFLFFTAVLSAAPLFPGEKWSTYTPSATLTEQNGTLKVILKKTPSKITYASIFAKLSALTDFSDFRNVEVSLKSSQKIRLMCSMSTVDGALTASWNRLDIGPEKSTVVFDRAAFKKKEGTKIYELLSLAKSASDFTESDIKNRTEQIINSFIKFLDINKLLK